MPPPFWATWWFRARGASSRSPAWSLAWLRRRLRDGAARAELRAAHDAQMAIMPQADPGVEGFEVSGVCVPAHEVGGDFFDYSGSAATGAPLCIVVGDVSGKGMRAAMTAALSSGMVTRPCRRGGPLAAAMTG